MRTDGRPGLRQPAGRRQADPQPAPLFDLPAVAAVGAVRGTARGRRSRQAQAGLLLRRGPPAVQRRGKAAAGEGRAGRAADPLQGRGHLFRHPEPGRHSRRGAGPAGQPHPARPARLHPGRPEGPEGGVPVVPRQSGLRHRRDHPGSGRRRGPGLDPGRQGRAQRVVARTADPSAGQPPGSRHRRRTRRRHGRQPGRGLYDTTIDRESAEEQGRRRWSDRRRSLHSRAGRSPCRRDGPRICGRGPGGRGRRGCWW
jgi:hypothetical protein